MPNYRNFFSLFSYHKLCKVPPRAMYPSVSVSVFVIWGYPIGWGTITINEKCCPPDFRVLIEADFRLRRLSPRNSIVEVTLFVCNLTGFLIWPGEFAELLLDA